MESNRDAAAGEQVNGRLGSWKEIAAYLNCGVRTVQRWERLEGLPVHRHVHNKMGSVYAYGHELDTWRCARKLSLDDPAPGPVPSAEPAEDPVPPVGGDRPTDLAPNPEPPAQPAAEAATQMLPQPELAPGVRSGRMARGVVVVVLGGMLVLAAFLAFRLFHPLPKAEAGRAMLAVLPFTNLSGDPSQDYFSDGLTEEMITQLGRVDPARLGVIARTSAMRYKRTTEDVAQIGRELGVSYVLEGSVRREQQEVRISAQLIQVSDQTHVWAQSYEFRAQDVLAVQQEVAREISNRIQVKLAVPPSASLAAERLVDPEAYEDYLKGRYFWNLRTDQGLSTAIDYFKRSIGKDPSYAPAYAGLADSYTLLALYGAAPREVMPQAKAAALKSLSLDDSLPEAHTSFAGVEAFYDWNWPEAERQFKRALELSPNSAPAHHWYAQLYLIPQGRYDEAIAEMKLAQTLDPVSLIINTDLGWTYFVARQDTQALEQYKKALEMSPQFVPLHFRLGQYYAQRHMYDAAVAEAEASSRLDGSPGGAEAIGRAYAAGGYHGVLQEMVKRVEADPRQPRIYAGLAVVYAELGDKERAFDVLEKAFQDHAPDLIYLRADPIYDSIRNDPRFEDLEQRVGLVH